MYGHSLGELVWLLAFGGVLLAVQHLRGTRPTRRPRPDPATVTPEQIDRMIEAGALDEAERIVETRLDADPHDDALRARLVRILGLR